MLVRATNCKVREYTRIHMKTTIGAATVQFCKVSWQNILASSQRLNEITIFLLQRQSSEKCALLTAF